MAEGTSGGADTVAVDIEDSKDCVGQQISNPDSSSASSEGEGKSGPVPSEVASEDDSSSTSEDDQGEIIFKREHLSQNWVSSIKGKIRLDPELMKSSSASKSCSIHRVPNWLRKKDSNAYEPQLISVGPLHYEKRKGELRAMEEHKWRYLNEIVSRKDEGWLEDCLAALKGLEERARNYYSEVILLDSDSFVEMMLLDGCFILEFFRREWVKDNDVIFRLRWPRNALHFDLLLMENQIPFFILQRLFVMIDSSDSSPSLVELALNFFFVDDSPVFSRINGSKVHIRHLLHLMHTAYVLSPGEYQKPSKTPRIPCAAKLEEAGIKFRKMDVKKCDFLNIRFDKGVIEIPARQVWDKTEREFLNHIAFEQCYHHCNKYITTYYHFMDCLINTAKDVEILSQEEIIDNRLGSDELVASHFNNMVRGATKYFSHFYLSDVCMEINEYNKRRWPRLRASLVHDYFSNPWAIISFLAAIALLLFAMTQTFFTSFPKFAAGN